MSNVRNGDHFESLFEYAPISLWEEDYSGIKQSFDALRSRGITDLEPYLDAHPEEIENHMRRIKVRRVNHATLEMFNAVSEEQLLSNLDQIFRDEMRHHFRSELAALWRGDVHWSGDGINYRLDGEPLNIRLHWRILPECESNWDCVLVSIENTTALRKAEKRFHHLFTYAPISLWEEDYTEVKEEFDRLRAEGVIDLRTYLAQHPDAVESFLRKIRILAVNQKTLSLFAAPDQETLLANLEKVLRDDTKIHFVNELVDMWDGKTFYDRESVNFSLTGDPVYVQLAWTLMPGSEDDFSWVLVALQDITARKNAEEYLRYLGTHDVMTELYNRAFFEETLIRLEAERRDPISMIIVDLNELKLANDRFGHHMGDKLIRRAAEVLRAGAKDGSVIARIGGDEFILILPDTDLHEANELIEGIQALVTVNNNFYRQPLLSLSLGAAASAPGLTLEKVISLADDEMYRNKGMFHRRRKEDFSQKF